jgi:tetratricopeptide (TPR) repeat protein
MIAKTQAASPPPAAPQEVSIEEAIARAHAHWNAGQADQAEFYCRRVLDVWPGQADALHLLGLMAHSFGNLDLALQYIRQACLAPRASAQYFSNLAEMCRQKGLLDEAERAGRQSVTLNPNLAAGWNNLGIILQESGKFTESAECLERVVAMQRDNAEAHNNLANTYKRLGKLEWAEREYGQALRLNPRYAEAHSNLASLLTDLGHFDRAVAEGRLAIEIAPRLADAYINLAAIEYARRRFPDAIQWLDVLLGFAPQHPAGLSTKAMALKELNRLDEALTLAQQAASLVPGSADVHNTLGQVLQEMDRFDEAMASYAKAASLPGTAAERALVNRATLLMEAGRASDGLAAFDAVIATYPNSAPAWFVRAELKTFTAGDPDIARMEMMLRDGTVQPFNDRMSMHFALGKAYLDAGDATRAFQYLDAGNRMKRGTFEYDAEATGKWLGRIAEVFSRDLLKGAPRKPAAFALTPIFIVGLPRSGTTLIEQILASHPEVTGAGELITLQHLVDSIGSYPDNVAQMGREDFARLGQAYLAQVTPLAKGRQFVVDKMPANFLHAGLIRLMLPNARIIHSRRDPVDTCLSCYTKLFTAEQAFAYDLGELGRFYRSYQGLMAHWRAVLPSKAFIEIDYEAVVDDLEGQARRLIDFLGLTWDEACLRFHETRRPVRTASLTQVRRPLYASSVGRWRKYAPHLGPLLAALDIDPSA